MRNLSRILFISTILILALNINAQVGTFMKVFSGASYDEGIASFRLPDYTYRIVGNTGSYGWGNTNIWLIALDSSANFMWHKTYGKGGLDIAEGAVMDSKGNIFIVGSSTSDVPNSYQIVLYGVDSIGFAFTQKYYGGYDWEFGHGIELLNDTTLMLVGETYTYGIGQSDAWMIQVNNHGDSLWSKTFGGAKKDAFYRIKPTNNDGFILAGQSQSYGNGSYDAILLRTNLNGDSIWFNNYNDTTDGGFYDLAINDDSSYVAVGYQRDSSDTYDDLSIMKFDKNGQFLWNRTNHKHKQEANYKSIIKQGNNFIVAGKSNKFGRGKQSVYGSLLNNEGWWISSFFMGGKEDEYTYSMTTDSTDGLYYLLTGTTKSYGLNQSGVLVLRMDSSLSWDTTTQIMIPSSINNSSHSESELYINASPNPFTTEINIERSTISNKQDFDLFIYDVLGHEILRRKWSKNTPNIRVNTSNWLASSYIILVKSENKTYRKLMIHTGK